MGKLPMEKDPTAAVRMNLPIPLRRSWSASQNSRKRSRKARKVPTRGSAATKVATLVISTQNRIVGTVVLENPVTKKI